MGAGPAGAILALLLARRGVRTLLLEAQADFDREFRGDTLHPSVMELLDELGLAERVLALRHSKIRSATVQTPGGPFTPIDLRRLRTRFPYITMVPQTDFLEVVTAEAARYPSFSLRMHANVRELLYDHVPVEAAVGSPDEPPPRSRARILTGPSRSPSSARRVSPPPRRIVGVTYRNADGALHDVRAVLTVGADGRFSRVRRLAGLEAIRTSPPMDVLWFRLPREPSDPEGAQGRIGRGRILVLLDRGTYWQTALVIPKGSFRELQARGIEELRRTVTSLAPELAGRVGVLTDWSDLSLLQVESDRLPRWYMPGLLLIGDAAHVMSPVGGVGINYAIQDAVEAANVLTEPLLRGQVDVADLAEVQRRRQWPTRFIQGVQGVLQRQVLAEALASEEPIRVPRWLRFLTRVPLVRDIPARIVAFGPRRVKLDA